MESTKVVLRLLSSALCCCIKWGVAGGIVSPEGRCAPEGELMRGIFHPVTTGGWLTPIYCDSKENHSRELFQTANKQLLY